MNIEEIRLKYQATGDIVEEEMDFLFSEIDRLRSDLGIQLEQQNADMHAAQAKAKREIERLSALAATHLADQELLVGQERKRVARECASIAREQAQAPPGAWGDGATYNAMKIVRLIKERYGVEE